MRYHFKPRQKYGNIHTEVDGWKFDSRMEASYYQDVIKPKLAAGELQYVDIHPVYRLAPGVTYEADFCEYYADGHIEVIDVKGVLTPDFKIKMKLFNSKHPLALLKLVQKKGKQWVIL